MLKYALIFVLTSSTAFASLPPHYERARILNYVVSQSAGLFPFDGIAKLEKAGTDDNTYWLQTDSGCTAKVMVQFKNDHSFPPVIGPAPFDKIMVIEKQCPPAPVPAEN